jgi:uncharacterized glyoxalase superfamily protein PhnB
MKITKLTPMLYTNNIKETVDFYEQTLGFKFNTSDEGWVLLLNGDVEIMFSLPNKHIPFDKPTFTGSFYFYTNNVDQLWEKLKDKTKIAYPIENFEYGMREFAVIDNNGYLLQFGEEIN